MCVCVCGGGGGKIWGAQYMHHVPVALALMHRWSQLLITKSYPNIYNPNTNPKFWSLPGVYNYKATFAIIARQMSMSMMMMIRDELITKIANKLLKLTICWPINTNNWQINWHTVQYVD